MAKRLLFDRVFEGAEANYAKAVKVVDEAIAKYGEDRQAIFPSTAYGMCCYYAYSGNKDINTLGDIKHKVLPDIKQYLVHDKRSTTNIFHCGVISALSAECIELCKYAADEPPYVGDEVEPGVVPLHGHLNDAELRELGLPLVLRDIPGFVVMIGPVPENRGGAEMAAKLIKGYQGKGIFVFLVGGIIDQAMEMKLQMGFKVRVLACGYDLSSVVYPVSLALRAAIVFGGIKPGDYNAIETYTFERIFAFVNAFDPVCDETVSYGAGAICLGFPVITDDEKDLSRVPKSLLITDKVDQYVDISLECRDIKIKVTEIDLPEGVLYSNSFEGEIVRRADMQFDANGAGQDKNGVPYNCFEFVHTVEARDITDHEIKLIGKDFDEFEEGAPINLCWYVEVAGKGMQPDFEPVFERKFHQYINCINGVMHTGQRDIIRVRLTKEAYKLGFRARHFGEVLYAKIKGDFDKVVDKCAVTVITDPEEAKRLHHEIVIPTYAKRDERIGTMTDESVDIFYSCVMCQSFSPSHVCVVTPERLGLCGAVSWLDAKATYELDNTGPCQIVGKGGMQDENIGRYDEIDECVKKFSRGALERVTLYSIMEDPMTSCGCFECICGIDPMTNGVVIVNREYPNPSPIGMTFADLASMTGGGVQTPGFMGHGKQFISSKKFMRAEGGFARIVWMPKELKDQVRDKLNAAAKEVLGIDNFCDMIADETLVGEDPEELLNFVTEKGHPVLQLEPLM